MIASSWSTAAVKCGSYGVASANAALRRPTPIRAAIALGHRQLRQFVERKQAQAPMLVADPHLTLIAAPHAIGHDQHFSPRQYFIDPTVEDPLDNDRNIEFFANLADETSGRVFAGFQPPTW